MRLNKSNQAIEFEAQDINGNTIRLSDFLGKPVVLSFFRDASCPFCNMRVFEYTKKFDKWRKQGIEVITVFTSDNEKIQRFVQKNPRPFFTIGDPDLRIYQQYGVDQSVSGLLKALLFKAPRIISGFYRGAKADVKNPNAKVMPADFIISPSGRVLHAWYGRNASDHIPMRMLERFHQKVTQVRAKQAAKESAQEKSNLVQMQLLHAKKRSELKETTAESVNIGNSFVNIGDKPRPLQLIK